MHTAVVLDRNKQYLIKENSLLSLDKLDAEEGEIITVKTVLMFSNGENIILGDPYVKNISVSLKVIKQFKDKKVTILKFKRRKHHMKKCGHRQKYTLVKVISINK